MGKVRVTRAGWFNFEGFGRPFEGWCMPSDAVAGQSWRTAGRAFTWMGARRKARRHLRVMEAAAPAPVAPMRGPSVSGQRRG